MSNAPVITLDDIRALWNGTTRRIDIGDGAHVTTEDISALAGQADAGDISDEGEPTDEFLTVIQRQITDEARSPQGWESLSR